MKISLILLIIVAAISGYKVMPIKKKCIPLKQQKTVTILADNGFANGLYLMGTNSATPFPIDTLYPFNKTSMSPSWNIGEWASKYSLKGTKPVIDKDTIIYQNDGKKISFLAIDHTTLVGLEVVGSKEYASARKEGESWTHLLLEQKFREKVNISSMKELIYTINGRLLYDENKMGKSYDNKLHTAQVSLFLAVQNVNELSSGYGDFFWFGMPLYDYRYRDILQYAAQDLGKKDATRKFILNVASKELFSGSLQDKKWVSINKDVYPLLINAFNISKKRGFLIGTAIKDLAIASANIGWEVPGTFDCGIQFKNLSLTALLK